MRLSRAVLVWLSSVCALGLVTISLHTLIWALILVLHFDEDDDGEDDEEFGGDENDADHLTALFPAEA